MSEPAGGGAETREGRLAARVLAASTFAFTICFACWMLNGVLVTYLVDRGIFAWDEAQMGLLIAIPVLTGAVSRLPLGLLTDRFGGKSVFISVMLASAVPLYLLGHAQDYGHFLMLSLLFGLAGGSFSVGVAYLAVWFRRERQGTALGVFGAGALGSALTPLLGPGLLGWLTQGGDHPESWRLLPQIFAGALLVTAVIFAAVAVHRLPPQEARVSLVRRLEPLAKVRAWRFGYYYMVVFGGFVAMSQWLIPYYVNVYGLPMTTAGLLAAAFSLPAGGARAVGGWLADRFGARWTMYRVFGVAAAGCALLAIPRMDIYSPGAGISAKAPGVVAEVSETRIVVGKRSYELRGRPADLMTGSDTTVTGARMVAFPTFRTWHEPRVEAGAEVAKYDLLAKGVTHIYFQANIWIFSTLVLVVGLAMGIGMAGVFKYIPDYFPQQVGAVGGMVGVLGGLGGFVCPLLFGILLKYTGIWTTCWMVLLLMGLSALLWLHHVVQQVLNREAAALMRHFEHEEDAGLDTVKERCG